MKKILLTVILLATTASFAQKINFENQWKEIDSLELLGLVETANDQTISLLHHAKQKKRYGHFLKAKIFHYKFYQLKNENSNNYILKDVNKSIVEIPQPYKSIFYSYKANFLLHYYHQNRWKLRNRSKLDSPNDTEIETWSAETLTDSIIFNFEKSLEHEKKLIKSEIEEAHELLSQNELNREYKPTLFDLLAYEAIDFYSNSSNFTSVKPENEYFFTSEELFSGTDSFSDINFPANSLQNPNVKVLQIYQKLESLHEKKRNHSAAAFAQLERLNFVFSNFKKEEKWQHFISALEKLNSKFTKKPVQALILLRMAEAYENHASKNDEFLVKAVAICKQIINDFPDTNASQRALHLKNSIEAPALSTTANSFLTSKTAGRIKLDYKNLDSVSLKVIKVPHSLLERLSYRNKASILNFYLQKNVVHQESFKLPKAIPYKAHSTEISFPGLELGTYVLFLQGKNHAGLEGTNHTILEVTNLGVSKVDFDDHVLYRTLNRKTGEKINNVKVEMYSRDKNLIETFATKDAELKIPKWRDYNYNSEKLVFSYKGDTTSFQQYRGRYYSNEDDGFKATTMFYLDRAIYRPGQKVYFKGIALKHHDKKTEVIPNQNFVIYVENPNNEEIVELELSTNEFGSFSGEFQLPTTGLTGRFFIYAEENAGTEHDEFWENGDYQSKRTYFNVEEYKRPTFKVDFDTVKESFKFGDSVSINVMAESFMGSKIGNTNFEYEITRQKKHHYWHYYEDEVKIFSGSGTTSTDGSFSIKFPTEIAAKDKASENLIYEYSIKATVTDVSGETREGTTSLRIGMKNLLVNLNLPQNVQINDSLKPTIEARNLNQARIPVQGTVKIFKLESPDRILHERLWEAPQISLISEEEFKKLYPEEPYDSISKPQDWQRGKMVYISNFENDGLFEPEIPITNQWQSGKYIIEATLNDGKNTSTEKKVFEVVNPADKYLPDNQPLNVSFLNKDFYEDGYADLLIQTAYSDLNLNISAFNGMEEIFSEFKNINGKEVLRIPVKNIDSEKIQIVVSGIKNNKTFNTEKSINIEKPKTSLIITTESFRNKIEPGSDETWSFKIEKTDGKISETEVLASMYDASLDQFSVQNWETNPQMDYSYIKFPNVEFLNKNNAESSANSFPRLRYTESKLNFDQLDFYGFNFSAINDYEYRLYLKNKRPIQILGNTIGRIVDESGMPLPGINIEVKGTNEKTITNFDGEFALDAKPGDVLIFNFLGFAEQEQEVPKDKKLYIIMEEVASSLDAVVVTSYGFNDSPNALAEQKISGAISENAIILRGVGTINRNEEPLFIVDGKPASGENLDSSEIVSMEILKAEEATAIYGAKASNGAVIITTKKGLQELTNVTARENLDETAFFFPDLKIDSDGKIKFSFTSPEALTQWKLRLLAHTKNWETGKFTRNVVTQKELSVTPNAPRFVREGDEIVFKTKISNLSNKKLQGTAILQLFDAITMKPIDTLLQNQQNTKVFSIEASQNGVVSWNLAIPEGVQAITYRVLAKSGDFSDGEENFLPVLSNRMLVTESIPLFVRAGETEFFNFKNLANSNSKTLENHQFTLEYTSNPAWYAIQSLPYLMEFEHECSEQIFARLYANSISSTILNSEPKIKEVFDYWRENGNLKSNLDKNEELKSIILAETPWLQDAKTETEKKQRLGQLFEIEKLANEQKENIAKLRQMQLSSGAFPWFSGGRENNFITRHIVAGFGHMKKLGVKIDDLGIVQKAISAIDNNVEIEKNEFFKRKNINPEDFYGSISNLHYLYARSFYPEHEFPKSVLPIKQQIIEANKKDWISKRLYHKAMLVLVFARMGEKETAKKIARSLKESAVKSDNYGMYWKENSSGWYWYQSPVETQALLIEVFSELGNEEEAVEEMKIWLLQNKRTNHWPTTKSTTEASYALLMQGKDWLGISDNTTIKIGGAAIPSEKIKETEKEAGTGYLKITWNETEMDNSFSKIEIENSNTTAGYGGAYWQYFEDLDKIETHTENPLQVEKELYLNKKGETGEVLQQITTKTPIKIGDLVTVRLVVRATSDMEFIHLKDMRASGFEPTNVLSGYKYQDGTAYYESTKDAATHFFFDKIRKGTYVLEYSVRANNAGFYSNGISTIQSMYAPEFSGHTKGINVKIEDSF